MIVIHRTPPPQGRRHGATDADHLVVGGVMIATTRTSRPLSGRRGAADSDHAGSAPTAPCRRGSPSGEVAGRDGTRGYHDRDPPHAVAPWRAPWCDGRRSCSRRRCRDRDESHVATPVSAPRCGVRRSCRKHKAPAGCSTSPWPDRAHVGVVGSAARRTTCPSLACHRTAAPAPTHSGGVAACVESSQHVGVLRRRRRSARWGRRRHRTDGEARP